MFLSLKNNVFPITDKRMTRFNITIDEAIKFVLKSMKEAFGGKFLFQKYHHIELLM